MIYKIENEWLQVKVLNMGASILSMKYFDGSQWLETTLEYENHEDYKNRNTYYLNSIIGPHSGRIKDGVYTINDNKIILDINDRGNHLHGSNTGFHTLEFSAENETKNSIHLIAHDTNNQCDINVRFEIQETQLNIKYEVNTHIKQVFNMTQHTYFNLGFDDTIETHEIKIPAQKVCYLDGSGAPEKLVEVSGPFDMREKSVLKDKMRAHHSQFDISDNIDHPFLVNDGKVLLESPQSGIGVAISSSAPYVVVYTGNYLCGENKFKNRGVSKKHQAIAIEPQDLPNDVNLKTGRNQIVRENDKYIHEIKYNFYNLK